MSAYTVEQIQAAMTAPVEEVTSHRTAKLIAIARIAAPIAAAEAAKARRHRIAAESAKHANSASWIALPRKPKRLTRQTSARLRLSSL